MCRICPNQCTETDPFEQHVVELSVLKGTIVIIVLRKRLAWLPKTRSLTITPPSWYSVLFLVC